MKEVKFDVLKGLVLENLTRAKSKYDERIRITASGRDFLMFHDQDCCEQVVVESICGEVDKALGEEITEAVEHSNSDKPSLEEYTDEENGDSWTWTYYTIRTQSETIVIRWYGTSNGYYSESVEVSEIT